MSDFRPPYIENSGTLWSPGQTGSFPLGNNLKFWLDPEQTGSWTFGSSGGYFTITQAVDLIGDIVFTGDGTYPPVYGDSGSQGYLNDRPTIWFSNVVNAGSTPHRYLQIGRMTSSIGAINGLLPGGNDDRSVFYVAKYHGARIALNGFAWQYGDNFANETYGVGVIPSGSANLESGFAHSSGTFMLPKFGSAETFDSGSTELGFETAVSPNAGEAKIYYQFHSASSTGSISLNGESDAYQYNATLNTDTGSDGSFFFGGEVEGNTVRPHWTLAEMLILDGVPNEEDRQRIEGYLAWKWDLTGSLPVSHPYYDTQPLNSDGILSFTFTGSNVAPQFGSVTGTFSVNREGGFNALTATIDEIGTAISGTDYTDIFPLNLNWEAAETGSKDFTVTFLSNPSGSKTFIPVITDAGNAVTEEPTGSSTTIIYPGVFNFQTSSETIGEGQNTTVQINRESGTFGDITASILFTGTLDPGNDLTFSGITFSLQGSDYIGTASFADDEDHYIFAVTASDDITDESTESASFDIISLDYSLSASLFNPTGVIGQIHEFTLFVTDNESGSLRINNPDGYYIYTASMPVTWSIERLTFADGIATATVDLIASGGYSKAVFGVDYTGSSGSFPYSFTWADQESGTKSFSIETLANSELTGVSISPIITSTSSSFGTELTGSPDSQPAWITYPGELYMIPTDTTVNEGESFNVQLARRSGKDGHLTGTITFTGTAISGTDYHPEALLDDPPVPPNYYLAVPDDDTSTIFKIQTVDDVVDEDNETITISINNDSGTIYHFSASDGIYTDGALYAFNTSSLISTNPSFITSSTTTIIDNETGTVNFASDFTGTIYVTGTQNLTYSVERTIAGDFATTATIDLSASTTAVEGLDYTGSTFPLSLSWADQETGSKTFTVNFLNNSARTGTLFVPVITASTTASIGTASFSTTQIVHPGTIDYTITAAGVTEGATYAVNVRRLLGTFGDVTGNLSYAGTATRNVDYTAPDTFTIADGASSTTFNIVTVDDVLEDGQSETVIVDIDSLTYPLSGSRFYPTASIGTNETFTLTVFDNETGSVNFSTVSASVKQLGSGTPNSLTITVERSGGIDFAATATITQVGGTATTSDYSGLPATLNWEDQESDDKTFTITAINAWGVSGSTLQMGFTTLVNLSTGTNTPNQEITFTNNTQEESEDAEPLISPDGTVNSYANSVTSRRTKNGVLPFSLAQRTVTSLRARGAAPSGSAGGSKNG